MERISTGVEGLDNLCEGGIPEGFSILVCGSPGTGKTILGLQFIRDGIKRGEVGIYVSFEQFKEDILTQADQFGWTEVYDNDKFSLMSIRHKDIQSFMDYLKDEVEAKNAKRLVIDSLSVLSVYTNIMEDPENTALIDLKMELHSKISIDPDQYHKQIIYNTLSKIRLLGVTTILISEQVEPDRLTRDQVSEFVADGVVVLKKVVIGKDVIRSVVIEKMRKTKINGGTHNMEFTDTGIRVN